MWGFIIAAVSGILMCVQGVFNTQVTDKAGLWLTGCWVQLTAFLVCAGGWYVTGRNEISRLWQCGSWYYLLGGVFGAVITATVVLAFNKLGPAAGTMVIVASQIAAAGLIEFFGLFGTEPVPFSWRKLLGAVLTAAGIILYRK